MTKEQKEVLKRRESKWISMITERDWNSFAKKNADKVKERVRKGIPDSLRGKAWTLLSGETQYRPTSVYEKFVKQESKIDHTILVDLDRTFPDHILFGNGNKLGRQALLNVLKAYSLFDTKVQYCQGMGFVVGLFLMYVTEEEAFWMMHSLMWNKKYNLFGLYQSGLPLTHQFCYILEALIAKHIPKLGTHLTKHNIPALTYATEWFMTMYLAHFSGAYFESVVRMWDVLFNEGPKILFRVALLILKTVSHELLEHHDFGELMMAVKKTNQSPLIAALFSDPEKFVKSAIEIDISTDDLAKHAKKYQKQLEEEKSNKAAKAAAKKK